MQDYDSIIIGAGHNGLVCATYLAKAGHKVLVLEAGSAAGGLAATREFHPGFRTAVAHRANHFSGQIEGDLDLSRYGYSPGALRQVGLNSGGEHVVIADGVLAGASDDDAHSFLDYERLLTKCAQALAPFWCRTIPGIASRKLRDLTTFGRLGLKLRGLGRDDMREFMRIASLPARDLMDEYFDNGLVKALLSWDGLIGSRMAPRSPNSAVLAMLYRRSGASGDTRGLVAALDAAAIAAGVEIRYEATVDRILVDADKNGLRTAGVRLVGREEIASSRVVSSADPKRTFIDLLGVEHLDIGFTNRIGRLRCDGYVAKLHLALDDLPEFTGLDNPNGRLHVAPDMDAIEFAFDDAKYGQASSHPVMEVTLPSIGDASLAPAGRHVLSANVMYVPYAHKGGWTDAARDAIQERTIATLQRYAPRIREQIVGSEFLTPADLEREFRVTGGHWHHTEFAMDQMLMMRPTYGAAQYRSPVAGLWLCGAGCHPAGDLTGLAGRNAAKEVLR
ncbi:MAG: NAD(P)/FAD-dependent oxidoreductase [Woeseiaceae bacterium]|nr:NAD(P)/FAD-dependent oxidoreductase [Woeseiaceae bacterium]